MVIRDDGRGMSPELLARVTSPFATTRTTRKVGLGIPMMQENAEKTGGKLSIRSTEGEGTELTVTLDTKHIDCLPLGDLSGTLLSLILMHPDRPDFHCSRRVAAGTMRRGHAGKSVRRREICR